MLKNYKTRLMIYLVAIIVFLVSSPSIQAETKPKLVVLPFVPEQGQAFNGKGLAVQNLLENVLVLHPDLKESWFNWKLKEIFPNKTTFESFCHGTSELPDMVRLGEELGIQYWLYGTIDNRDDRIHANLTLKDIQKEDHEYTKALILDPADHLVGFRKEFLEWLNACGLKMPEGQVVKALWQENTSLEGLDLLGKAWMVYYNFQAFKSENATLALAHFEKAIKEANHSYLTLNLKGWALYKLREYKKAKIVFKAALDINPWGGDALDGLIWCAIRSKSAKEAYQWAEKKAEAYGEEALFIKAFVANHMANIAYEENKLKEAIPLYEQAMQWNPVKESYVFDLARVYQKLGEYEKIINLLDKYLPFFEEKDRESIQAYFGILLRNSGKREYEKRNYAKAVILYEQAMKLWPIERLIAPELAKAYAESGEFDKGMEVLDKALLSCLKGEQVSIQLVRSDLMTAEGLRDFKNNNYVRAQKNFLKSIEIIREIYGPEDYSIAFLCFKVGQTYSRMNDYDKALENYEKSFAITLKILGPEELNTAEIYFFMGTVLTKLGDYAKAMESHQKALAIWLKKLGPENPETAYSYCSIGEVYFRLGDYAKAMENHQKALAIALKVLGPEHPETAAIYNHVGGLFSAMGDYAKAMENYQKALAIRIKMLGPEHPETASSYNNIGMVYTKLGGYLSALDYYVKALDIMLKILGPEHLNIAYIYRSVGEMNYRIKNYNAAFNFFLKALPIAEKSGAFELKASILSWVFGMQKRQETKDAAIFFGKQYVNSIQQVRGQIQKMEKKLQQSYITDKEGYYKMLVDLLIDQGRLPEAQQILAMLKEEEFYAFLGGDAAQKDVRTTSAAYNAIEKPWIDQYDQVKDRLVKIDREYHALSEKEATDPLSEQERIRFIQLDQGRVQAQQAFDNTLTEMFAYFDTLNDPARQREVGSKKFEDQTAIQETLRDIGQGVVLVQFLVTDEQLRIILTTPDWQQARSVIISSKDLNHKIYAFRECLQNPNANPFPMAKELYNIIIKPIAADLVQADARVLMLSLNGTLRYLPLAALHDGSGYMAERYMTVVFTEAVRDKIKDLPGKSWRLAGLGNSKAVPGYNLPPLPSVTQELEGIVKKDSNDQDGVLPGVVCLDHGFDYTAMREILRKKYPVVHIASHFKFKPGDELNSFLMMGDGTPLTLLQIKKELEFNGVELMTLSACNTAMGGMGANGREVEGFAALVQQKGAKAVLASLWPVADISTGLFMKNLYSYHESEPGISKAAVLQKTQIEFIRGEKNSGHDKSKRYAHPYYWAPFILMGNWL